MKRKCLPVLAACLVLGSAWSAPPRSLMVSVRIDSDTRHEGQGAAVVLATGQARAGAYATERSGSRNSIQQVGVVEGSRASLSIGQTLVLPLHQVFVGNDGIAGSVGYSEAVVMRDIGSGFTVMPRLQGQQVQVEIALHQELPTADPLTTGNDRLATTVSGPLGQWILVGGAQQQEGSRRAGLVSYGTRTGSVERRMWVKVDLAR